MTKSLAELLLKACDNASHDGYAAAYYQKLRPILQAVSEVVSAAEGWVASDEMMCPYCSMDEADSCVPCECDIIVSCQLEDYQKTANALSRLREVLK